MQQYLMSVHYVEGEADPAPEIVEQMHADVGAFNASLQEAGTWVFGGGLHTPDTATVVRAEGGDVLITDGPFPEAKEQIGGFWIVKAPDLDAALALAAKASAACRGPVEVRPFHEEPDVDAE
jgi:hypothetical protein